MGWPHPMTFSKEVGCAWPFLGFILFVAVVAVLSQVFF
jgi:hypothetical protein